MTRIVAMEHTNQLDRPFVAGSVVVQTVHDVVVGAISSQGQWGTAYGTAFDRATASLLIAAVRYVGSQYEGKAVGDWLVARQVARALRQADATGAGPLLAHAIGILELALLDLAAKSAGVSVRDFLGLAVAPIPVYLSGGPLGASAKELATLAEEAAAMGATVVKIKIDGSQPDRAVERTRELIQQLPAGVQLAVDANQTFDREGLRKFVWTLAEHGQRLAWVEEPLFALDFKGLAEAREMLQVPLAAGETLFGEFEVGRVITEAAADRVLLNPARAGGPAAYTRLGDQAAQCGLTVASHVYAQVASQLSREPWPDLLLEYLPWWDSYFADGAYLLAGGQICVSSGTAGFGFAPWLQDLVCQDVSRGY